MMSLRRTSNREVNGARVALLTIALGVIAAIVACRASANKPSSNSPSEHGTEATTSATADTLALFTATLQSTMSRMHDSMRVILASRRMSVDSVFAAAMIVHHQGAIDMARAELRFGHSEQLRRLAQGIIVTQ